MSKIRVLTLTHEYPPVGGGGGRVAQDIAEGLANRGFEVWVLTAHYGDLPTRQDGDVTVRRIHSGRTQPFRAGIRAMLGYVIGAVIQGYSIIRRWKPDILHVHFAVPAGAAAWLLHLLTGVPYMLTVHLGDVPGGVPEKTSGWFRWVYPFTPLIWRKAARVVAVSEFTRRLAKKHYDVPIDVVYNGVDLKALDPGVITVNLPPQVVFAGRFVEQKNPLQVVRTLAGLQHLDWKCVMLGDGPLRPLVEKEIAVNHLQDRFRLPGWVTPEEVLNYFRESDILFLPSRSEGLPVVGVQACALGLALVLSRAGGCIDLVEENRNGFLVEQDDGEGFRNALSLLLSSPGVLQGYRRASRGVADKFDLEKVIESYSRMIENILRDKTGT